MKSFALVSSLAVLASAARKLPGDAASRSFQEGAGRDGTNGQWARFSKASSLNVLGTTYGEESSIAWNIRAWTVFYEDSGTQRLRLEHTLEALIFATDTINFEIAFRPQNEPDPTDVSTIGEDYVSCDMSRSTTDGAFWSANVAEGMYVCKGDDATNRCLYISGDDSNYEQNPESTSDWVTPYEDDDEDDFWCTKANTEIGETLSPFECTAIKCIVERDLYTGFDNEAEDLKFTPKALADGTIGGTPDKLVIQPGRAKLYINKTLSNFQTSATNGVESGELTLDVPTGATSLLFSALSAVTVTVAALAF